MNRGYTLLFAVLTAALVLGVAVFILSVSKKQYDLSVTARDSVYALYAADSGIECAAAAYGTMSSTSPSNTLECNGTSVTPFGFIDDNSPDSNLWNGSTKTVEDLYLGLDGGTCALITITYGYNNDDEQLTRIVSRGYNQCDGSGPKASSRTVERAFRLTYR